MTVAKRTLSQKIVNFWQCNSTRNKILIVLISLLSSSSLVYILIIVKSNFLKPTIKYHGYLVPIGKSVIENTWMYKKRPFPTCKYVNSSFNEEKYSSIQRVDSQKSRIQTTYLTTQRVKREILILFLDMQLLKFCAYAQNQHHY